MRTLLGVVVGVGLLAGSFAAACSNDNAAPARSFSVTVDGMVDGGTPMFVDVGSLSGQGGTSNQGALAYAEVYATSEAAACGWLNGTNNARSDLVTLALFVSNTGGQGAAPPPIVAGTYMIGSQYDPDAGINQSATANLLVSDSTCHSDGSEQANMGSITFTSITADAIVGTYDVTFYSGDHLTGSFNAPTCTSNLPPPVDAGDAAPTPFNPDAAIPCHP